MLPAAPLMMQKERIGRRVIDASHNSASQPSSRMTIAVMLLPPTLS